MMAAGTKPAHHPERPLYAILLRLGSMVALGSMFATVKLISEHGVSLVEGLFFRQLFSLPIPLAAVLMGAGLGELRTSVFRKHVSRATLGLGGLTFNFLSFIMLPLAEATTFGFTVPIFATILSALMLREAVGRHRWAAVALGFLGVLIVLRPGAADAHLPPLGVAVALTGAIFSSLITIYVRDLSRTEQPTTISFWYAALSLVPLGALMFIYARPHEPMVWGLMVTVGLLGGLGQLTMTAALKWAPVSVVIPMDYSMLIWTTALGWLIWGNWPPAVAWVGTMFIVASGLYIAWREWVRLRDIRSEPAPVLS